MQRHTTGGATVTMDREALIMNQLSIKTHSQTEMIDITAEIQDLLRTRQFKDGLCLLYVPHTTAGITYQIIPDGIVPASGGGKRPDGSGDLARHLFLRIRWPAHPQIAS
jgi:hypothetical protein